LDLYSPEEPFYTHPRFLPGTKIDDCSVQQSLVSEGCVLSGARITQSVIGIRAVVREGSVVERSIVMGANNYEWNAEEDGKPAIGIGRQCVIRNAILDLDTRIGDGVQLINAEGIQETEKENYAIRGGVIVVPRGSDISAGTVI